LWKRKEVAARIQESFMSKMKGKNIGQGSQGQARSGRSNQTKRANEKLRKIDDSKDSKRKKAKLQLKVKEDHHKGKE
jgi:hypothetical protein